MGKIRWSKNWVTFMDSMLQAWLFLDDTCSLYIPTRIQKLTIDMKQHILYLQSLDVNEELSEFQMLFCMGGGECTKSSSF
jgi:fatty acid synthase